MTKEFKKGTFWKTRCGLKAEILCTDLKGSEPIVARLFSDSSEFLGIFHSDGKYFGHGDNQYDLLSPWEEPRPWLDGPDQNNCVDLSLPWQNSKPRLLAWICLDRGSYLFGTVKLIADDGPPLNDERWERYPRLDELEPTTCDVSGVEIDK